jgi:putative NADPH-quinone reductase
MGLFDELYEIPGVRKFHTTLNQLVNHVPPPPSTDPGTPRKILLVTSHPVSESFSLAIAKTIQDTAKEQGHELERIDLGLERFAPALTNKERKSYFDEQKKSLWRLPRDIRGYIKKLQWCDTLVLVYPTWWMNTPANLKGFFDRTLLLHHTWDLPKEPVENDPSSSSSSSVVSSLLPAGLTPGLCNIQRVVGVSTYGASRSTLLLAGDNGRNMINKAILPLFHEDCTIRWHGLYDMDFQNEENRKRFLKEIKTTIRENL